MPINSANNFIFNIFHKNSQTQIKSDKNSYSYKKQDKKGEHYVWVNWTDYDN
jgi:hypothetical protein